MMVYDDDDDKSSVFVNPGYEVSPFKIEFKSVQSFEREEVINIKHSHKLSHI